MRDDFPIFQKSDWVYLDSAATTQKPQVVIDAIANFYARDYATVHRAVYEQSQQATALYDEARSKIAMWIGSHKDEVIFTRGTTDSINLVAGAFAGQKVLISEIEHHANIVPWQLRNCDLHVVPVDDRGELVWEEFLAQLDRGVKLVSVAHISNTLGTVHPVKRIVEEAHKRGALVLIDGAQAAGHMSLDMRDLDADFYAFSGHKMYGPTGIGVLYGKMEALQKLPPAIGGGDMIEKVSLKGSTFLPPPLRFEAGTPPICQVIGLAAAVDYLQGKSYEGEGELITAALEGLAKIPRVKVLGQPEERGALVSFVVEGAHPLDVATLLGCRGIALRSGHMCSQPAMERFGLTSSLRLSVGLYNCKADIAIALQSVEDILNLI